MKTYNLNCGDMFGRNDVATELYNSKFVPYLEKIGIKKDKELDNIFSIVKNIVEEATSNARIETEWELNAGEGV